MSHNRLKGLLEFLFRFCNFVISNAEQGELSSHVRDLFVFILCVIQKVVLVNPRTGNALRHGPSGTAPGDQPDNGGPGQRGAPDTAVPVRGTGSGRQRLRDEGDADTQGDAARRRRPPFAEGADGQAEALRHPEEGVQEQQGGGGEGAATHADPARIQVWRTCAGSRSAYPGDLGVNFLCLYCYRVLMADLSDDMTDEDVSSVKFLIGNRLPRERMEKAKVRQTFVS